MDINNLKKATELANQLSDLQLIDEEIDKLIASPVSVDINNNDRYKALVRIMALLAEVDDCEITIARLFKKLVEIKMTKLEQQVIRL